MAVLAQLTTMRSLLRDLGASRTPQRRSSRPRTLRAPAPRQPRAVVAPPEGPMSRLALDPWAALARLLRSERSETEPSV